MLVCCACVRRSDFISFHTPLTSETSNLLNEETIALCKEGELQMYH